MFKKTIFLFITSMVFFAANVFALDAKPQGELEVMIIASASPDFIKEWAGSSYSHAPHIQRIREVERNQTFYVALIASGYGVDEQGKIDLTGSCTFLEPSGKVSFEDKDSLKIKVDKAGHTGGFLMFDATFDVVLEDTDPLGEYIIKAVVKDNILNTTATGEYKLTLKEKNTTALPAAVFDSEANFGKWVTYYYLQPEPAKISSAIKYYAGSTLFDKANSRVTMAAFYAALFRNDPKLMEKTFVDISAGGSNNSKEILLRALWMVNSVQSKELINKASQDWKSEEITKQIQDVLVAAPIDILKEPIKDAGQLDMLWSSFLATGDSTPVKRIISVIHFVKDGKGMDMLIGQAANWSLGSNAMQHKAVYAICKEEIKTTDPVTSQMLQEIVDKVDGKPAN